MRRAGARVVLLALVVAGPSWAPSARAQDELPVFDTHLHYSREAWARYPPGAVVDILAAANVPRALVSSTPDDGTLELYREDSHRFVPILRPYRTRADMADWFRNPRILAYLAARLERGIYRGVGEFHLLDEGAAQTPQIARLAEIAVARDIWLHVHAGAAPVRALLALEPRLKVLWAHAGMSEPAGVVGDLLDRHERLWAELSFRAHDVAPGGRLDEGWRALMLRHSDRFMIGTDTYVASRLESYGEIVAEHRRWLARLPRASAEAIAYRNAVRLFGAGREF